MLALSANRELKLCITCLLLHGFFCALNAGVHVKVFKNKWLIVLFVMVHALGTKFANT